MQTAEPTMSPTHTVLITGFENEAAVEKYRRQNVPRTRVAEDYTIPKARVLFMIFYDVQDAAEFVKYFGDATLRAQHSISKYEIPRRTGECTGRALQSTVSFSFQGVSVAIEDSFVAAFLKQHGEIKEVRPGAEANQRVVEFFDQRAAQKAFDALNGTAFGTGTVKCAWTWDLSLETRSAYLKATDMILRELAAPGSEPPKKRFKTASPTFQTSSVPGSSSTGKRHPFIECFDRFIGNHINEIERTLKF